MKHLTYILIFAPLFVFAQIPYKGGENDGHAMAEIKNVTVQSVNVSDPPIVKIFPNPVLQGESVFIKSVLNQNVKVTIYSAAGSTVYSTMMIDRLQIIPTTNFKAGFYLIEYKTDVSARIEKLVLQ